MSNALSAVAAVIAAAIAWIVHRGQLYELARDLHRDLTTGDVEKARDIVGTVVRSDSDTDPAPVLKSYFVLLWSFERITVGRRRISRARFTGCFPGDHSPLGYLDDQLAWHVNTLFGDLPDVEAWLEKRLPPRPNAGPGEKNLDSWESKWAIEELHGDMAKRGAFRRLENRRNKRAEHSR